ncbi:MAG: BlaI/MecI/CopY family transcriptional regulator [Oscillospiraceae bacterium]|nr:BlaI/MecI/CopY family transcriptional regulator [Oscillospiraceae bacterium]
MNITDSEMKLMKLIWDNEPVKSGEVVAIAAEAYGWKKSTVYTIVKKLVNKGAIKSEKAVIISCIGRDGALSESSETVINKNFGGSLPMFLAAFLSREKLTRSEAEELKRLIDDHTEGSK